ncbi:hypothetical protein CDO44_02020 [Pigmentiphaga sp. NML080357]|uniref:hypothetical protein n=1 Tax=Pigmentiphaga sp. NML080357 TaxID=2008675 RepID=UPI000B416E48|nr:hypothetical protein [Pigmentiphaga sp. NML080357]OVZ64176.1 hypothetical protein CDO44_02020 [Pigmentiphaga sp. NML080357]
MADWFGKVKGHVGEAKRRFEADAKQRADAEATAKSTILTDKMLQSGQWDSGKVLFTTLNGGLTQITANELAAFRHNMQLAKKQAGFSTGKGITARQVIDLASAKPLVYLSDRSDGARSDIDRARKEITMGVPVSALHDSVRFITNAGGSTPGVTRHHVTIQLVGFRNAVDAIIASGGDQAAVRREANKMRKGGLKFDCSCDRHRYFLRYVATIGGFNAGRDETGFPKIRNPGLKGVACKHVLRVMTELESSNTVLRFLERHLQGVSAYKANTTLKQTEAEEAIQSKAPARIKTSEQRKVEADKARDRRAAKASASRPKARPPKKIDPYTRRIDAALKRGALMPDQVAQMRTWGWDDKKISRVAQ